MHSVRKIVLENTYCLGIWFTYCFETSFLTDLVTGDFLSAKSYSFLFIFSLLGLPASFGIANHWFLGFSSSAFHAAFSLGSPLTSLSTPSLSSSLPLNEPIISKALTVPLYRDESQISISNPYFLQNFKPKFLTFHWSTPPRHFTDLQAQYIKTNFFICLSQSASDSGILCPS